MYGSPLQNTVFIYLNPFTFLIKIKTSTLLFPSASSTNLIWFLVSQQKTSTDFTPSCFRMKIAARCNAFLAYETIAFFFKFYQASDMLLLYRTLHGSSMLWILIICDPEWQTDIRLYHKPALNFWQSLQKLLVFFKISIVRAIHFHFRNNMFCWVQFMWCVSRFSYYLVTVLFCTIFNSHGWVSFASNSTSERKRARCLKIWETSEGLQYSIIAALLIEDINNLVQSKKMFLFRNALTFIIFENGSYLTNCHWTHSGTKHSM